MESILFCLDGRDDLANAILSRANSWSVDNKTIMGTVNKQQFSDSEVCIDFVNSVRGKRIYLLTSPNTSDKVLELIMAIDAGVRADAEKVIPIIPMFPYARSDKKDQARGPIGGKAIAKMIQAAGATSVILFDLHADQIQGFFDIPVTHIEGKNVFLKKVYDIVSRYNPEDVVFCAPDAGATKRLKRVMDVLEKKYGISFKSAMIDKTRKTANEISKMVLIGDVKGKNVVLIDDIVDTAGTLAKGATLLKENGALDIIAIGSHPILSGKAYDNIWNSPISELFVTDSLPIKEEFIKKIADSDTGQLTYTNEKIKLVGLAQQIGMAIAAINNAMSYEELKDNERSLRTA